MRNKEFKAAQTSTGNFCVTANDSKAGWILWELRAAYALCKVLAWHK